MYSSCGKLLVLFLPNQGYRKFQTIADAYFCELLLVAQGFSLLKNSLFYSFRLIFAL